MFNLNKNKKVIIVAEISANHGQNYNRAVSLIKKAAESGADSVKFQVYTPDTMTIDVDNKYFRIKHPQWGGQTLYQLYKRAYTPWSWFKKLKKIADSLGVEFFATAFDKTSVDFLEDLGVGVHKVASFELTDLGLIEYMAKTRKPLILSTGMASISEIKEAVAVARKQGVKELMLLKCLSSYPADPREMNLRTISDMRRKFNCPVGLSDHSLGSAVSLSAVSLGAVMIEKHFTLSRQAKNPDSFFSMEPEEFRNLVKDIRTTEAALGKVSYQLTKGQKKSLAHRRSLFAVKDISKGEKFSDRNIGSIRPAQGLAPKHLNKIIGREAKKGIKKGTPLDRRLIV